MLFIYNNAEYLPQIKRGQDFITSILRDYEVILYSKNNVTMTTDMKVLKNVVDLESSTEGNIIVQSHTERFWEKVIEATGTNRVCALGTPGIGKSTTTCILIRLLLRKNITVVYRIRNEDKGGFVYMFTPNMDTASSKTTASSQQTTAPVEVDVKVIGEIDFQWWDINVNNESVYYVVDPGKTKDNCNLGDNFKGNVIIVASPEESHWGNDDFFKGRGLGTPPRKPGTLRFFPTWTLQELICSSAYISSVSELKLSEAIVIERFNRFGGNPRYVFAPLNEYSDQKNIQQKALVALTIGSVDTLMLAYKDRSAINSQSSDLPKGILLSYILARNDNGAYKTGWAVLSSDYIYDFIVAKFMQHLWNKMISDAATFDAYLYEAYVRKLFYDNVKPSTLKEYRIRDAISKYEAKKINAISAHVQLGGCVGAQQVENIEQSAVTKPMVVFYPYSPTNKLIDFLYRDDDVYNCFQCTIGENHGARSDHIAELANFIMNERINKDTLPVIKFFYAVPRHRFRAFVTKPLNASKNARVKCGRMKNIGKKSVLYLKWDEIVAVKILCVNPPTDPASQPSTDVYEEDVGMTDEEDVGMTDEEDVGMADDY